LPLILAIPSRVSALSTCQISHLFGPARLAYLIETNGLLPSYYSKSA